MTGATNNKGLSSACCHNPDPKWPLFPSSGCEVSELVDVMYLHIFPRPAELTFVRKEPFHQFIAFGSPVERKGVDQNCHRLSSKRNASKSGDKGFLSLS